MDADDQRDAAPVESLAALAQSAAAGARSLLAAGQPEVSDFDTKSSPTDLVTRFDREAEAAIVARISAARPDDSILGEEGGASLGSSGVRWIIDPLDGTTNFLYGYPAYAVSIAVEVNGRVEVGVVHDVVHDVVYRAVRNHGATVDDVPLAVSARADLSTALVATGFSYDADRRGRQGAAVARLLPAVRDVRRGGSAALDLCWLAQGRVDAYWELGLSLWDLAAGALIAEEAGAVVDHRTVGDVDLVVGAGPALYDAFTAALLAADALSDDGGAVR